MINYLFACGACLRSLPAEPACGAHIHLFVFICKTFTSFHCIYNIFNVLLNGPPGSYVFISLSWQCTLLPVKPSSSFGHKKRGWGDKPEQGGLNQDHIINTPFKGDLLSAINNYYNDLSMLNIFNTRRLKKHNVHLKNVEKVNNYVSKPRHYPPANKEWFNSIYTYNNNTVKLLPVADKVTLKLVKSYFNFYSRKLEKKIRSRRLRMRVRRLSTNRILVSRAELKHTNDKVVVTIYVYNRQKKYYINKINRIATIDQIDNLLPVRTKKILLKEKLPWPSALKMKVIKKKALNIKSKVKKEKRIVCKTHGLLSLKNKADNNNNKFENYELSYLKHYVSKSLHKEMLSVYFRQLISFNESKFEKKYLLPLTSIVTKVYNKKVEFNIVNLKYLYLNSYIFSETLVTKLRNRKNRLLRVLRTSLLMFKLPSVNRAALYDEIYNRIRKLQNLKVEGIIDDSLSLKSNLIPQFSDKLEQLLFKIDPHGFLSKLKGFRGYLPQYSNYPLEIVNTIFKSLKHKYVSGIRLEVAGRLTRRNTAARSIFKLRYKGNIKNMDSSYKRLSTVLLRGYAKSNLQYTKLKSKIRIGSFGLKGWVSSS